MKKTDEDILEHFGQIFGEKLTGTREVLNQTIERNILYYLGQQWFDRYLSTGKFGPRYPFGNVPMPVTNKIREHVRSMTALNLNKRFVVKVWPNSNEQKDKDAAKLGEWVLEDMDAANCHEIEDIKEWAVIWTILSGNAFPRTYFGSDNGMYVVGPDGKSLEVGKGEIVTECILPFNAEVPMLGDTLRKKAWAAIKGLKNKEWVEDIYGVKLDKNKETGLDGMAYQSKLMQMVATVSSWQSSEKSSFEVTEAEELVIVKEIEYRPTKEFPKGRYAMMCQGNILENNDKLPIPVGENGEWDYTLTHLSYNYTPGCFWATGGVDDLISPQNTINKIDQDLEGNRENVGRPWVLTPKGLTLTRRSSFGSKLLELQWDSLLSGGAKPEVHSGVPFPAQINQERENKEKAIQDASGDPKNILSGQSPHAKASGRLAAILREGAEASHGPDIARFYRGWARVNKKRLILAQDKYTEKRFIKIAGPGNKVFIKQFRGADLHGNTDVRMELDSGLSTTYTGKTEIMMELLAQGFFGEVTPGSPTQREMLTRLGLSGFPDTGNIHRERAEWENSVIVDGSDMSSIYVPEMPAMNPDTGEPIVDQQGIPVPMLPETIDPLFEIDNDEIHVDTHDQLIFSREFRELPEERQVFMLAHRTAHSDRLEQRRQQAMMEQMVIEGKGQETPPEEMPMEQPREEEIIE